jgi:hypothetical protein
LKYRAFLTGFRHREFPIVFDERRAGKSKMSTAIAVEAMWKVWSFWWTRSSTAEAIERKSHANRHEVHLQQQVMSHNSPHSVKLDANVQDLELDD